MFFFLNKSYKNSSAQYANFHRPFDSQCLTWAFHSPTHTHTHTHWFVTKWCLTQSLLRLKQSKDIWFHPVRRESLRHTPSVAQLLRKRTASPQIITVTSTGVSLLIFAGLFGDAQTSPYETSFPSELSGGAGGSSAKGDWAPPGPSVYRRHSKQHVPAIFKGFNIELISSNSLTHSNAGKVTHACKGHVRFNTNFCL